MATQVMLSKICFIITIIRKEKKITPFKKKGGGDTTSDQLVNQ